MEAFSFKWFTIYYAVSGLLLLIIAGYLIVKPDSFKSYLLSRIEYDQPPLLLRKILKYLLLFTIPCLILSFFPFSWPEFLFSVWSLFLLYLAGSQLVRWTQLRKIVENRPGLLRTSIRWLGVIMLSAALVIFFLEYMIIERSQLF